MMPTWAAAKILSTVLFIAGGCGVFLAAGCDSAATIRGQHAPPRRRAQPAATPPPSAPRRDAAASTTTTTWSAPRRLAHLEDAAIEESSGIAASRRTPDLFWTHNDSGDGPFLFAFDGRGKKRGVWRVAGAEARDWEDIAAGPGQRANQSYLYIGDIGDNGRRREQIIIYRVPEPIVAPTDAAATKKNARLTASAEAIRLQYPDGRYDAEALLIHPTTGDLYIVTKTAGTSASVYKLAAPFSAARINTLVRVAEVRVQKLFGGMITGGDISPDGRRVVLCDYLQAYELRLPERPGAVFDDIWAQPFTNFDLGGRVQGEAIGYTLDGKSIVATSEKRPTPLIEVRRN